MFSNTNIEVELNNLNLDEYQLIDVRDPMTAGMEPITSFPHKNIPLDMFRYGLPEDISPDGKYIFSCYHGISSLELTQWLRNNGFTNAFSLKGGYEAIRQLQ